ncbi:FAD-dependent oxidoreductase [Lentzea sp. NPDC092896]|uniref:FAD-dependent oxidoreductase n=1 Tax=Lentzea sp. NPDC092896 TaxID=3364127 RepID=UPI0038169CAB
MSQLVDIVVIGAGSAGLLSAISSLQAGARSVVVLESAPEYLAGGNSSLTKNLRFIHNGRAMADFLSGRQDSVPSSDRFDPYSGSDFLRDWLRLSDPSFDRSLIRSIIERSEKTIVWMHSIGHRWKYERTILPGAINLHLDGGGQGLQRRNLMAFFSLGGRIYFNATIEHFAFDSGHWVVTDSVGRTWKAWSLVLAAGGFEASTRLRVKHLGEKWRSVPLRGVPFNTGHVLETALAMGARPSGRWDSCHATPQSLDAPAHRHPGQMHQAHAANRYAYPLGVVVDASGRRFFKESEDYGNHTYASLGAAMIEKANGFAYQVFSGEVVANPLFPKHYFDSDSSYSARTLRQLAHELAVSPETFEESILESGKGYSIQEGWYAFPTRSGLTFTYGGLKVGIDGSVIGDSDAPIKGLFAAGEIVGGLFGPGYPGGSGLTAGAVLGRASGASAALHALNSSQS